MTRFHNFSFIQNYWQDKRIAGCKTDILEG
jgi:hypothetical protein